MVHFSVSTTVYVQKTRHPYLGILQFYCEYVIHKRLQLVKILVSVHGMPLVIHFL